MLLLLQDAGFNTLNDLLVTDTTSIVNSTGLQKTNIVELCAYARRWKALENINHQASPEPETDHGDVETVNNELSK